MATSWKDEAAKLASALEETATTNDLPRVAGYLWFDTLNAYRALLDQEPLEADVVYESDAYEVDGEVPGGEVVETPALDPYGMPVVPTETTEPADGT